MLVPGGNVTRAKANIEAVRILKKLNEEKRDATPEEKKRLAQFTGWGSLAQEVFNTEYAYAAQYEKRFDGGLPPALRMPTTRSVRITRGGRKITGRRCIPISAA